MEGVVHSLSGAAMVCRECPYHGRKGIEGDYRRYPLVARENGRIVVIKPAIDLDEEERAE